MEIDAEIRNSISNIFKKEVFIKIEKRLAEIIEFNRNIICVDDLKRIEDIELLEIMAVPTPFDFTQHEKPSPTSFYVWIHEFLKQQDLYKKFLSKGQVKIAQEIPFGEIYLPKKGDPVNEFIYDCIMNLHLDCLIVLVKEGIKNSINVDQPRKYLQDIGNDELIEEIKALEKE